MKHNVEWSDDLTTGQRWQDMQHKNFIRQINQLFYLFSNNGGKVDIEEQLVFLRKYADEHFGLEEKHMAQSSYPDIEPHIQQHESFRDFLEEIAEVADSSLLNSARLCNKLNLWFVEHIKEVDKKMAAYLIAQGDVDA
ncbi:MAG: hemerythrin family protein [SAR324 cluster bacterium]|nr:hemerythrin family protein [SAR324 cluster bacterium]